MWRATGGGARCHSRNFVRLVNPRPMLLILAVIAAVYAIHAMQMLMNLLGVSL